MQKIIEKLKTPKTYAGIIAHKLDRFSRNLKDILILQEDILEPADASLISIVEKFDTSTPTGKLMFQIIGGFAEFERETIKDRTTSGRIEKAKQGRYAGGRIGFGYDVVNKELIPNEKEAKIVQDIFQLRNEQELGFRKISNWLNAKGLRTKGGREWTPTHVRDLLNREVFYRGMYKYGNVVVPGKHSPILK